MDSQSPSRQKLIKQIKTALGSSMIDVELEHEDYDYAVDLALDRYRQRSSNSMEESYVVLNVQPNIATYSLAPEIEDVRQVYRRTFASGGQGGSFDPFSAAVTQSLYQMNNPGGLGGGGAGWLATYDYSMQYQNQVAKMFGRDLMFNWDRYSKRITFHRKFTGKEQVIIHV
ncbi:MAG: hypothetical protein EOP45_18730, partial [Sphingobacteriaceae bacterium]